MNVFKEELRSLADTWPDFQKRLMKLASVYKLHNRISKLKFNLRSRKTTSLLFTKKISLNIHIDQFVYRSNLEKTNLASLPSKKLKHAVINLYLPKLSTLTNAKLITSKRTDITLQKGVTKLTAITMRSTFIPDSRYDKSILKLIGNVFCPNDMYSEKLRVHKKFFQFFQGIDYQCPQCKFTCQVRNFSFEQQTKKFPQV